MNRCDIIAKRRGSKTEYSELHQDLLGLGKIVKSFNRWKANKAFYLTHSDKFISDHQDELMFDRENNGEPTLVSLYEVVNTIEKERYGNYNSEENKVFPGITYGNIREYLAKKFSEGVYSYDEAFNKMLSFNKEYKGSHTFMATIEVQDDRQYKFSIVYNTEENQEKLIQTISEKQAADRIKERLQQEKVGVQSGKHSLYNSLNPKQLLDGLTGLLTVQEGKNHLEALCKETGHFINESIPDSNPLKQRLVKLITEHPEAFRELLGEEEFNRYFSDDSLSMDIKRDELIGHLIGKYLEEASQFNKHSILEKAASLINRIIDYIKSHFTFADRELKTAMYNAKWAAFQMAQDFLGDNFQGSLNTALQNKKVLEGYRSAILNSFQNTVKEFQLAVERTKDIHFKIHKQYKDTFKGMASTLNDLTMLYTQGQIAREQAIANQENPDNVFTDMDIEQGILEQYLKYAIFLSTELENAQRMLRSALENTNSQGEALSLQEHAKAIKYNDYVYDLAEKVLNMSKDILQNNVITNDALSNSIKAQFKVLEGLLYNDFSIPSTSEDGSIHLQTRYSQAILECKKALATRLLVQINGSAFLSIDNYVSVDDLKVMRHAAKVVDLRQELDYTDINPWGQWFTRWVDSMADNPDLINQMVYDCVEEQKHRANINTLELREKLFRMYQQFQQIEWIDSDGTRKKGGDTKIFFERYFGGQEGTAEREHSKTSLTGNLISERNWGEWEKDLREDLSLWETGMYEKTITYSLKMYNPDSGTYETKEFTYGDVIVIATKNKEGGYNYEQYVLPPHPSSNTLKKYNEAYFKFLDSRSSQKKVIKQKYTSKSDMFNNTEFLLELGAFKQAWHEDHSKKLELDELDDEGKHKKIWVPALASDGKREAYDNEKYNFLLMPENKELLDWYNSFIELKRELDKQLPEGSTNPLGYRAPQFMGTVTNRLNNAISGYNGGMAFGKTIADHVKFGIMESPDDYQFGGEDTSYDLEQMTDAQGKLIFDRAQSNALAHIERVPVYGVKKLKNLNNLSTDLFQSTLAYGSMAYNYNALQEYVGAIEVLSDTLQKRKTDNVLTTEEATKKNDAPPSQSRLQDYIRQQIYNDYSPRNHKKLNKAARKLLGKACQLSSMWFLGGNIHSAMVNATTGFWEMWKEAGAGDTESDFTKWQFLRAQAQFLWNYLPWKLGPMIKELCPQYKGSIQDSHNKLALFLRRYNFQTSNERTSKEWHIQSKGYGITKGRSLLNLSMLPYELTDEWMQSISFIATAMNTKLTRKNDDGTPGTQTVSLWDLWEVKDGDLVCIDNTALEDWLFHDSEIERTQELLMKKKLLDRLSEEEEEYLLKDPNVTYDMQQDNKYRIRARAVNNRMHGVYNSMDGGAYVSSLIGPMIALMKRYAIGLIDRRFSRVRYDYRKKKMRQGTTVTAFDVAYDLAINPSPEGIQEVEILLEGNHADNVTMQKLKKLNNLAEHTIGVRQIYGLGQLFYLVTMSALATTTGLGNLVRGSNLRTSLLKRRGYSEEQICNIDKAVADSVTILLKHLMLSYVAPPEEVDTIDFDKEYDNIWAIGKLQRWIYTKFLTSNLLADRTINDDDLDIKEMSREVFESDHIIPFSLTGMLYYNGYRSLKEQYAYFAFWAPNWGIYPEYKSLLSTALPGVEGMAGLLKTMGYLLELAGNTMSYEDWINTMSDPDTSDEEINNLKKLDYNYLFNPEEGKGMEIFTRGENKNWYKYAINFAKQTPYLRSFMVAFNPAFAARSMEWATKSTLLKEAPLWENSGEDYYNRGFPFFDEDDDSDSEY